MPQAVIAAFTSAVQFIAAHAVLRFIATIAISLILQKVLGPKAPQTSFAGIQTTARGSLEYRKFGYGRGLCGGAIFWNNTHGATNQWLDYQIAYVDHYAEAEVFYVDNNQIAVADISWTPPTTNGASGTGSGDVDDPKYIGLNSSNALQISWYPGWTDQPANTKVTVNYSELDNTTHRARGVFNALFSAWYVTNTEKVWETGAPQEMLMLGKLRRVFDRRRYALNLDPNFNTAKVAVTSGRTKWFGDNAQTTAIDVSFTQVSNTLSLTNNDDAGDDIFSERFPVDAAKLYTCQANARQTTGDRVNILAVAFYDSGGSLITPVAETGWAALGTSYFNFFAAAVFPGTYTVQSQQFGTSGGQIPAGAITMALVGRFARTGTTSTDVDIQDMAIYENTLAARHDITDDETWEWSQNPANCLADYLFTYMNVDPSDEIDWEAVIVAAQACDVLVDVPGGTQKRFECNGIWLAHEEHENILEHLKASMSGLLIYTGGVWTMLAGVWQAPQLVIDENSLAGDVDIQGGANRDSRFNIVRGFYTDKDRDYKPVEFFPATNSAYVTRDGGRELDFDLDLRFINDEYQCQRVAIRKLDQFDNMLTAVLIMNEQGAKVYPGLVASISLAEFSWVSKTFRCYQWTPRQDGNFEVIFKEDFSSRYDDPLVAGYTTKSADSVIVPGVQIVPAPTNLTAVGKSGSVLLTWDNPPTSLYDIVEIWESATDDINTALQVGEVRGNSFAVFTNDVVSRFYWIRARNNADSFSTYEPVTTAGVSGTASSAGLVQFNYIRLTDGAQIKNGVGTLTLEARDVSDGVDTLLSSGTLQLYVGTTLVTLANGFVTGSDGYTGIFDAGDISGSIIVELKDGPTETAVDSQALVDTTDGTAGDDAVFGIIEPENGSAWTRAINAGAWTPSQLTTDLDATFFQAGLAVARISRRITLNSDNGQLTSSVTTHPSGDLNTSRVTVTVSGSNSTAITVDFAYSFGGEDSSVSETVISAQGGADGEAGSSAMNIGRRMNKLDQWFSDDAQTTPLASPWTVETVTGPVFDTALQIIDNDDFSENMFSERMTIDNAKKHRVSIWAKQPTGDRQNFLLVAFFDSSGTNIPGSGATAANWDGYGTYYYWQIVNAVFASTYTKYIFDFGGGASAEIPAAAASMAIGGLITRVGAVGTETTVQLQDYSVFELAADGDSVHVSTIHLRSASAPSTPTGGSYNFTTKTLTPPTSWTEALPATGANPLYSSTATWSINGTTGTDSSTTWSAPVKIDEGELSIGDLEFFVSVDISFTPNQHAFFQVNLNGNFETKQGVGSYSTDFVWRGNGNSADYEVMVTIPNADDNPFTGPTLGIWHLCSASREWHWRNTVTDGNSIANPTVSFRQASNNVQLGSTDGYVEASDI